MGFPVCYPDLFLPKLILYILTLISSLLNLISSILRPPISPSQTNPLLLHPPPSFSAVLVRELLPVVKFSQILNPPETCVVCLCEFDAGDDIRGLGNCKHVFHRGCIDRWMDYNRKSCPVCRKVFLPEDLQDSFNERLWAASGIADYYGDSSPDGSL